MAKKTQVQITLSDGLKNWLLLAYDEYTVNNPVEISFSAFVGGFAKLGYEEYRKKESTRHLLNG